MNKREALDTYIYIYNKYLQKQIGRYCNRFTRKSVNAEDLWFVIERLYPNFFNVAKQLDLYIKLRYARDSLGWNCILYYQTKQ